jgi:hypothetical protein
MLDYFDFRRTKEWSKGVEFQELAHEEDHFRTGLAQYRPPGINLECMFGFDGSYFVY